MKNMVIAGIAAAALTLGLAGCNTMNAAANTGHAVVHTGTGVVKGVGHATVRTVNTGARIVTSPFR